MSRHAISDDWERGDIIVGTVSKIDTDGRGRIGDRRSPIRVTGNISDGDYVTASVVSADGDEVVAERVRRAEIMDAPVWVQQSQDPSSRVEWSPAYPLSTWPLVSHSNLFEQVPQEAMSTVSKDTAPVLWRGLNTLLGLVMLVGILGIMGTLLSGAVGPAPLTDWGPAIEQSPIALALLAVGLAITYAGFATFEWLIKFVGTLVGFGVGFGVGGALVTALGLSGLPRLAVFFLAIGLCASLFGTLFLLLHYLGIIVGVFVSVATTVFYLVSGGVLVTNLLSSLSLLVAFALLVAVVVGVVAAIAAVIVYKIAIIVTTSFVGAAYLVYVPEIARASATETSVSFPNLSFALVFLTGLVVQFVFAS